MRHIPEEELHAYLDQGLSRSQCVEIESHLADCPSCQATRDGIAALRDRTTALLARLAPPRSIPPAFEALRRRAEDVASARRRRLNIVAWAASLVVAVGLGYSASLLLRPSAGTSVATRVSGPFAPTAPAAPAAAAPRPMPAAQPTDSVRTDPPAETYRSVRHERSEQPTPAKSRPVASRDSASRAVSRESVLAVLNPVPAVQLTKLEPSRASGEEFGGMWRTMSWAGAQEEAGKPLPHIDGLPVVQVQIQQAEGASPLTVVAQQLTSGQVIRTIEGSASDVSQLLVRRQVSDVDSVQLRGDSSGGANVINADHSMAMQFGDRMLAITGDLPPDSLRAMIRRMNAEMRSK
jgi:hypothetical protein